MNVYPVWLLTDTSVVGCYLWSPWRDWSDCTPTCDDRLRRRTRECRAGDCVGDSEETQSCPTSDCDGTCSLHIRPVNINKKYRDLRIVFLRSNRLSNRIGRPIRFRIEFSNRIGRIYHALYSEYLMHSIGIYFVFVTNESDARN